jgi:hypothetical protein
LPEGPAANAGRRAKASTTVKIRDAMTASAAPLRFPGRFVVPFMFVFPFEPEFICLEIRPV